MKCLCFLMLIKCWVLIDETLMEGWWNIDFIKKCLFFVDVPLKHGAPLSAARISQSPFSHPLNRSGWFFARGLYSLYSQPPPPPLTQKTAPKLHSLIERPLHHYGYLNLYRNEEDNLKKVISQQLVTYD